MHPVPPDLNLDQPAKFFNDFCLFIISSSSLLGKLARKMCCCCCQY